MRGKVALYSVISFVVALVASLPSFEVGLAEGVGTLGVAVLCLVVFCVNLLGPNLLRATIYRKRVKARREKPLPLLCQIDMMHRWRKTGGEKDCYPLVLSEEECTKCGKILQRYFDFRFRNSNSLQWSRVVRENCNSEWKQFEAPEELETRLRLREQEEGISDTFE